MKITILLPGHSINPVGGFKVAFEYANRLVRKGHKVSVILGKHSCKSRNVMRYFIDYLSYFGRKYGMRGGYLPKNWFDIDNSVEVLWRPSLNQWFIPDSDIIIATAWQTAEWVAGYNNKKGKKYYLIHDYEYYMSAKSCIKKRIQNTYKYGFYNIVTSPSGIQMLNDSDAKISAYIPNGIDFKEFYLKNPVDSPTRNKIGFPFRFEPFKGTQDAIDALEIVRRMNKQPLDVWTFGAVVPRNLPAWITFHRYPTNQELCELYNKTAILVIPSHYEGWGLPGAEAMACGAAVVSTDNGGVRAYAEDGVNALLVPPKNCEAIAESVIKLLKDDALRVDIAKTGNESIEKFTWDYSVELLIECLKQSYN